MGLQLSTLPTHGSRTRKARSVASDPHQHVHSGMFWSTGGNTATRPHDDTELPPRQLEPDHCGLHEFISRCVASPPHQGHIGPTSCQQQSSPFWEVEGTNGLPTATQSPSFFFVSFVAYMVKSEMTPSTRECRAHSKWTHQHLPLVQHVGPPGCHRQPSLKMD